METGREGRLKSKYKVLCRLGAAKVYIVYTHTVDLCGKVVLCDFFCKRGTSWETNCNQTSVMESILINVINRN